MNYKQPAELGDTVEPMNFREMVQKSSPTNRYRTDSPTEP